ncbi:MAG: hypothetical protein M3R03_00165, partial [Pseudomonadota bacterium]|nr:hypothetical protein [Pseudomonadota bacterium]
LPMLIDLPSSVGGEFGVTLALGSNARFRPTAVVLEANGQPLTSLRVDRASITGVATSVLGAGTSAFIDGTNSVDVMLSNPQALLYHADGDALAMGANAMLIGKEVIQFGRAIALGGSAYRLSELVRGRLGSEYAIPGHSSGEAIVLLDPARLVWIGLDRAMMGAEVTARAYGVADDEADPPLHSLVAAGESLRPLSPCHLEVSSDGASYTVRWMARRRALLGWPASGGDEIGSANFEVRVKRGSGVLMRAATIAPLAIPATEVDALGSGSIRFEVVELGAMPSQAAVLTLNS